LTQVRAAAAAPPDDGSIATAFPRRRPETAMQYRITTPPQAVDIDAISRALREIDPAGVADLDAPRGILRISTWATDADVLSVMSEAGLPVARDQLERVASECCGGCGG
jgi:hypothetical protein